MPKGFKEARVRLWKRRPFCHWCGAGPLVLIEAPRRKGWRKRLATLDHLRSKLDPTRQEVSVPGGPRRYVLACFDCNHRRGAEEYRAKVSLEEQWARSGRAPRNPGNVVAESGVGRGVGGDLSET